LVKIPLTISQIVTLQEKLTQVQNKPVYYSPNMKITILATVLALVASPLSASAGTTYSCKIDAGYEVEDDDTNPTYPTTAEKDWSASKLMTSYRAIHSSTSGGDFDMVSSSNYDFTLDEQTREKGQVHLPGKLDGNSLRGGTKVRGWSIYDALLRFTGSVQCNLCGSWDDDDAAEGAKITKKEKDWLAEYVGASETHNRWVLAYCDELQQGGQYVFEYASDCYINLYDCTSSVWNNEIEQINQREEAVEAVDIDESYQ
jgi:hypothetical protein